MAKNGTVGESWSTEVLRPFSPAKRYLIGVSGGRDSVALLHPELEHVQLESVEGSQDTAWSEP